MNHVCTPCSCGKGAQHCVDNCPRRVRRSAVIYEAPGDVVPARRLRVRAEYLLGGQWWYAPKSWPDSPRNRRKACRMADGYAAQGYRARVTIGVDS